MTSLPLLVAARDALARAANEIERLAFDMPPPNIYTPQFVMLAQAIRREPLARIEAALAEEPTT